jgi:hypothetical protein
MPYTPVEKNTFRANMLYLSCSLSVNSYENFISQKRGELDAKLIMPN